MGKSNSGGSKSNGGGGAGTSKQVRKLAADGKLTAAEIKNLTSAGIGMDKVIKVAGNQGTSITKEAQKAFGIDQNKGTGQISYTPALTPGLYGFGGSAPPRPGSGFAVTGQQSYQTNDPKTGSTNNLAPTYTYMGNGGGSSPTGGGSGGGAQQPVGPYNLGGYGNVAINGYGPNNIGPTPSGIGPNLGTAATTTTQPAEQDAPSGMQAWLDSLGIGIQTLTDTLNSQIATNQANQQSYMTTIDNLIGQMSAANQQMFSGPYAVTTQNSVPVMGAQTTQAINRRQKISNTSLSIRPETTSAGTGLNIAA